MSALTDTQTETDDWTEVTVTLPDGRTLLLGIGTSGVDHSALVQIDTDDTGNVRVFVNDGDMPVLDEDPETGDYRDMTPHTLENHS